MKQIFSTLMSHLFLILFLFGDIATFLYLVISDWDKFNWWNWILIIPLDLVLATLWPMFWLMRLLGLN
jgi:hypothetical protein